MSDPVLIAYGVKRRGPGQRAFWSRIGEAYPHEQGAGLTVVLDVLPRDGRIVLLERSDDDDQRILQRVRKAARPPKGTRHGK